MPAQRADRRHRARVHVAGERARAALADVGEVGEVVVRPHREPDAVAVGRRRVAADAGLGRRARRDLAGHQHVADALLADAEALQRADLRPHVVGERPVDDLAGGVDRRDGERRRGGGGRRQLDRAGGIGGQRAHGDGDRLVDDRVAKAVPQVGRQRRAGIAREHAQRVRESGDGQIDLEQVLAGGGRQLDARAQPVARHQRAHDRRRDAGRAASARRGAVEQAGRVGRRRRIDDRIGRKIRQRRWQRIHAAVLARETADVRRDVAAGARAAPCPARAHSASATAGARRARLRIGECAAENERADRQRQARPE